MDATVPVGWFPCQTGTTPDILSGNGKVWGVIEEPSAGKTYVGLITREDGTYESIGQWIRIPLAPKECYSFTLDVAHSPTYANYNSPLRLRVWGGTGKCDQGQLLLETPFITDSEWTTIEVSFHAKLTINYILIEAFYQEGSQNYRGNVLVDNITPIKPCTRASLPESSLFHSVH